MPYLIAKTKSLCERMAQRQCERLGLKCYVPVFWDRYARREQLLFSTYLFIERPDNLGPLWSGNTPAIIYVLAQGRRVVTLDDAVINGIKSREDGRGRVVLDPPPAQYKPGDKLLVASGKLTGKVVLFEGMTSAERCAVMLGQVRVTMKRENLTPA